jgi:signal peptide peptidase SppA
MKYPRIASHLYSAPWQILPAKFQEITVAFESARGATGSTPEMAASDPVGPIGYDWIEDRVKLLHPQVETFGPVALARVHGVTGRRLSQLAMQCGGFDTGLFEQQLENIRDDDSIRTLVIDFDTPGGMAAGGMETAQAIRAVADSGKRVIGYASGMCCSAGYFLACACDEFHAHPASMVGSVSTIWAMVDSSKAWEKNGLELKLFATGIYKATGYPGKAMTPEEEANCWSVVRPLDDEFKGFVSSRRGLTPDLMQGQWWDAKFAPANVVDSTSFQKLSSVLEAAFQL